MFRNVNADLLVDAQLDMGGYDIDEELFDPLGVLLTRCKSAKTLSRLFLCCGALCQGSNLF